MSYPGQDAQLVSLAMSGDEHALSRLIDECLPAVLRWCARLGGERVEAEDAAHDVLMVVITRIGSLKSPHAFPYWLFGITRNMLRTHRRRSWTLRWVPGAQAEPPDRFGGPGRDYEMSETAYRVGAVLERLPQKQREVLVLIDLEERTSAETSELLGVPQGTIKSRLRLARARFVKEARVMNLAPDLIEVREPKEGGGSGAAS